MIVFSRMTNKNEQICRINITTKNIVLMHADSVNAILSNQYSFVLDVSSKECHMLSLFLSTLLCLLMYFDLFDEH